MGVELNKPFFKYLPVARVKSLVKKNCPVILLPAKHLRNWMRNIRMNRLPIEKRFEKIYFKNKWRGRESRSGTGANLLQTRMIRKELPAILKHINANSLLDIPCGDFNWMREVDLNISAYIGADIVEGIIKVNNQKYRQEHRTFTVLDVTRDELPKVDVILCRDCLGHFSFKDISRAIANIKKSESRYLLTTTLTEHAENVDIITGRWRPLNLQKAPFHWPEPIRTINEGCTQSEGRHHDKSLGLWRISDIHHLDA